MGKEITIIGAGAMGSALTIPAVDNENEVNLWGTRFDDEAIDAIRESDIHPGIDEKIPSEVESFYSDQLEEALESADIVLIAVVSEAVAPISEKIGPYLDGDMDVMIVSKGVEERKGELKTMGEVFKENMPDESDDISPVIVGGPSIASELANRVATGVVYASDDPDVAQRSKETFSTSYYKVEVSDDLLGVSLCAALKNPYAISINLWDGIKERKNLETADNGRALFFNQSLKEMSKFVDFYGGTSETVYGLAGLGDLEVTAKGGRNSMFGTLVGKGLSADEALEEMKKMGKGTVEGYSTIKSVYSISQDLKDREGMDMQRNIPLLKETYSILEEDKDVVEAIDDVLSSLNKKMERR